MLPNFLVADSVRREDGMSDPVEIGPAAGRIVHLTLGITRIIEQESLDVSIWASKDGQDWGTKPVASFPQKFYCGTYSVLVDLADAPEARYLRIQWKMSRWGRGDPKPLFGFYVFAQESEIHSLATARA
jgi:hypothetical protein